jgi:hypothetical protein
MQRQRKPEPPGQTSAASRSPAAGTRSRMGGMTMTGRLELLAAGAACSPA